MKILITGALGYIGNQILKKVANKHEIYACDNSSANLDRFDRSICIGITSAEIHSANAIFLVPVKELMNKKRKMLEIK